MQPTVLEINPLDGHQLAPREGGGRHLSVPALRVLPTFGHRVELAAGICY